MRFKTFDWESILKYDEAYIAAEIASKLDINVITCRRHLQRAYNWGQLERAKKGRFYLYALPDKKPRRDAQLVNRKIGEIVESQNKMEV